MSGRKKTTREVYQPPGRRSQEGTPNKNSPRRQNPPPSCCEEPVEDGELQDTPEKAEPAPLPAPEHRDSWRSIPAEIPTLRKRNSNQPTVRRGNSGDQNQNNRRSQAPADLWRAQKGPENRNSQQLEMFHNTNVAYIDSHCHTDFIYGHLSNIENSNSERLTTLSSWMEHYPQAFPKTFVGLIANFIDPQLFVCSKETERQYDIDWIQNELVSTNLYLGTTWGCHPHKAQKWGQMGTFWTTLDHILANKSKWKALAVGECGIDLHRCESDLEVQKMVFEKHVALAYKYHLPLVIHCRNGSKGVAEDVCLEILKKQMDSNYPNLKIHRHCFTENWEVASRWLKQCPDVHFGFTPGILSFRNDQLEAVRNIPLDRILLETDSPYFKPKVFDGIAPPKVCLPGMCIAVAFKIAEIKNIDITDVLRATYNNTRRVYQIPVY